MAKLGWATAAIYNRVSLAAHRPPRANVRQKPLTDPVRLDCEGYTWRAVRTAASCERRVATDLRALGFQSYCPLGRKFVFWQDGRRSKKSIIREFPVFSRYILVGCPAGVVLGRSTCDKIEAVLGDSRGPLSISPGAVAHINDLELRGEWDETKHWREKSPFSPGREVSIIDGPFAGFPATVTALESESRLRVLINIFGRSTEARFETCQVAVA